MLAIRLHKNISSTRVHLCSLDLQCLNTGKNTWYGQSIVKNPQKHYKLVEGIQISAFSLIQRRDDSDVATGLNYGVVSSSNQFHSRKRETTPACFILIIAMSSYVTGFTKQGYGTSATTSYRRWSLWYPHKRGGRRALY